MSLTLVSPLFSASLQMQIGAKSEADTPLADVKNAMTILISIIGRRLLLLYSLRVFSKQFKKKPQKRN